MEQQKQEKFPTWAIFLIIIVAIPFWFIVEFSNEDNKGSAIFKIQSQQKQVTPTSHPSKYDLQIVSFEWIDEQGDYNYVRGSKKNASNTTIAYFEVVADYLDREGSIVDSDYTNDRLKLLSGAQRQFEIMHRDNYDYSKVQVKIGDVRFK